jgi:hypothetical protein
MQLASAHEPRQADPAASPPISRISALIGTSISAWERKPVPTPATRPANAANMIARRGCVGHLSRPAC